ncbi:hypothetical protein [Tateyamaria sp. ANG-S1]|uniref:hypothetical protein n=1 Tax=Tateyamaria sp. ANG-S1 TaxID=1577905 RepID=UPI00126A454D|nr:hypothetical protein [Tateyamaria sp. ANG-S1]
MARFLPDAPLFHVSAASGAALAGFLLADGFGRRRWRGHLIGGLTCVAVTLLGAWFGASIALAFTASGHAGATLSDVVGNAPFLGFIAIADALSTSLPVAATWAIAMTLVQLWMRRRRGAQPT